MNNRLKIMASITIFGAIFFLVQAIYLFFVYPLVSPSQLDNQQGNYPCARDCSRYPKQRTCSYDFTAEWYYSMSKACFACPFNATDCHQHHCIVANGVQRPVLTINRQIPGPGIQVCQGDRVQVTVHNRMDNAEGVTIHWHGQHQRLNPYMDGTSMITQCPIPHPQSFTYDFVAATPGTHWWHSHSGLQRADGIYGSLIVRQGRSSDDGDGVSDVHSDLYDVDDVGHVLMISDWTNVMAMQHMMMDLHADGPGEPDAILVNGRGTQKVFEKNGKIFGIQPEVFTVTQGLRYRFRAIGAVVTNCPVIVSVQNHKLSAIASDGAPCKPTTVDGITIAGGERYDFVIHADRPIDNYWIRFTGAIGSECDGLEEKAILRYAGAQEKHPTDSVNDFLEDENIILNLPVVVEKSPMKPGIDGLRNAGNVDADIVRSEPDVTHHLEVDSVFRNSPKLHHPIYYPVEKDASQTQMYTAKRTHMLNNISFAFPTAPLLSHARYVPDSEFCTRGTGLGPASGQEGQDCRIDYCSCIHTIEIEIGQVVELVLVAKSMKEFEPHPLHLHGNHFYVMAYDNGEQIPLRQFTEMDQRGEISRNLDHPPRKDTLMMARRYAILRFKADNPGWWLFHCHMDLHLELGMAVVFRVGGEKDVIAPPGNLPACVKGAQCNSDTENSLARHAPAEEQRCPSMASDEPRSSTTEAVLLYILLPCATLVSLACICFINVIRRFTPREDKYKYRRLSNGEMEMSLIENQQ